LSTPATLVGQVLSHYRITARVGAGGMGEVYRATDTTLGREVALKMLPRELASDPDRLARFEREAKLLASLNHPSIAQLYAFEQVMLDTEASCVHLLVMELVDGEDLKQRLDRGPIPVDETLEIALHVAEALEEAHGKGIVHRDLKPANVKLTPDGKVKVLDFGLAKAWAGEGDGSGSSSSALSQSPTLAHTGTAAGIILGTAAYMSPEQARGKAVDKRADVWSFGVLLWEMLTGRALFTGETVTDVIAAVVKEEPDLRALPARTPPSIRRLIARCLRKDPRQRLPDIGAARLELYEAIAGGAKDDDPARAAAVATGVAIGGQGTRLVRERLAWFTAIVVAVAGTVVAVGRPRPLPPPLAPIHFTIDPPDGYAFAGRPVPSPDGGQVVFFATPASENAGRAPSLWLHSLRSPTSRLIPGTEGAGEGAPFWSPDGRDLAFFAEGELRRIRIADGVIQKICAVPAAGVGFGDWGESGTILFSVFSTAASNPIYAVAATGGVPRAVTRVETDRGERYHVTPQFLAGGRRFLFTVSAPQAVAGTYIASVDRPLEKRRAAPLAGGPPVFAAGRLLWLQSRTLYSQAFDDSGAASGDPAALASDVVPGATRSGLFRASPSTLAFVSGGDVTRSQLAWLDRTGHPIATVGAPMEYGQIALSPDGSTAAVEISQNDLWLVDLGRGLPTRLTSTPDKEMDPVWSPDGREVAFCIYRADTLQRLGIRRKRLGLAEPETVVSAEGACPEFWTRDGVILGTGPAPAGGLTAWAGRADGTTIRSDTVGPLPPGRVDEFQVSPDGHWLAFLSWDSGRWEAYVQPFGRPGERVRVSANGGGQPRWRADGREFYFTEGEDRLMAVAVRIAGERLDLGAASPLFRYPGLFTAALLDDYAPSPDGQRFLVKLPEKGPRERQLHIVVNWTSLLEEPRP
jgi:eukaryotic-like serine/threonine-protein kinase